jgi:NitT/TauT family transport system substrate-binding protein
MHNSFFNRLAFAAAIAVAAACGPAGAQTADVNLRVGVLPIVDVAPLYLGMSKGFFKAEHLTIEPVIAAGGGAVTSAVVAGDQQFGYGNAVSMMLAVANGLPLQAVADGSQSIADGKHANVAIIVAADSTIKKPSDLQGKTLAVNALKTMSELMLREVLERKGVDVSQIKLVEIPNPAMFDAVKAGRVDAALDAEPFLTAAKNAGAKSILEPYDEYAPKVTLATYFTTAQYAREHADVVARFKRAMVKSLAYAQANTEEARRMIPSYTKIEPAAAASMALVGWSPQIDMASVKLLQQSMLKYHWIAKPIDLDMTFPADAVAGR